MKRIIWIDDNIGQMFSSIQGAISKLWKLEEDDGISSRIIIFGNACEASDVDDLSDGEGEADLFKELFEFFKKECKDIDGPDKNKSFFYKKRELIEDDSVCRLYEKEKEGDLEAYQNLKRIWIKNNFGDGESEEYLNAKHEVQKLIERMNIPEDSVIGIDLCLLFGDRTRTNQKHRIISMEIYSQLIEKGNKCFLYSADADDDEFRENWIDCYKKFYKDCELKIYQRNNFLPKGSEQILKEIEEMFLET